MAVRFSLPLEQGKQTELTSRVNDLSGARAFVTPEFVRCRPEWVTQAEPPEWQGSRALQETHWLQL